MLNVQKNMVIWRRQLTNGSQSATKRNHENEYEFMVKPLEGDRKLLQLKERNAVWTLIKEGII